MAGSSKSSCTKAQRNCVDVASDEAGIRISSEHQRVNVLRNDSQDNALRAWSQLFRPFEGARKMATFVYYNTRSCVTKSANIQTIFIINYSLLLKFWAVNI
jgi:hypothetical protein